MGHVPSDPPRAPSREHGYFLSLIFLGFILHLGMFKCFLFKISRGHTHSGLFLTNFIVLWFPTLTTILVKLVIFFILAKTVCKACYNLYINAQMCYFYCIFRALWLVTLRPQGHPCLYILQYGSEECMCTWGGIYSFNCFLLYPK